MLDDAEDALEHARHTVRGQERSLVLNDFDAECERIDAVLTTLIGPAKSKPQPTQPDTKQTASPIEEEPVKHAQLQLSWNDGKLVAWASAQGATPDDHEEILEQLHRAGASSIDWEKRDPIKISAGGRVPSLNAPLGGALGWMVSLARATNDDSLAPSVRWIGLATALAVSSVAQGRFAPTLKQTRRKKGDSSTAEFAVRWQPALIDPKLLDQLVESAPGAAMIGQQRQDRKAFTSAVLADITDTIITTAAAQVALPAAPPEPKDRHEIGETILARLDGSTFRADATDTSEIVRRVNHWAGPVLGSSNPKLTVELHAPDESNAWFAQVLAMSNKNLEPFEVALGASSKGKSKALEQQATRLERLFPALLRPGGRRRGEVILGQDEAWELMAETGHALRTAGFDVRVPQLSQKKAKASLRLTAAEAEDTVVGAQQLANVRWSAVFDDVELTAAEIAKLAAEAKPLVKSRGKWIELDQADLAAAAAALAERADLDKMSGADMLRHAMGLEGSPLGSISIAGTGWAADLLTSLQSLPENPDTQPDGFSGELRSYQADALSWLNFLDEAGLGGCLALDMGLGKTPTTLAALYTGRDHGPGLVIAPPAVVGNWATEAAKFVPGLRVRVHHGANRDRGDLKDLAKAGLVITTYGTAVRDMDKLSKITWGKVVIDEAQAIKNPAAETSQQLRRLEARTRVALTGTPIENGLGDLWSIMDWANAGLVGPRAQFISQLTPDKRKPGESAASAAGDEALRALNGILVYRRTKAEPMIAAELPDRVDELDHCAMTPEQIGLYQAVVDNLSRESTESDPGTPERKGAVLAAITALKQICNHPANYEDDGGPLVGRSGKLARLNEILASVFAADEKVLIFTHFATWGERMAHHLTETTGHKINCYHGGLSRGARDKMIDEFQAAPGAGALVLSLKAGGTGLNLTAANHVVLYDRWWNPAVEDQARDRVWRIGQTKTVVCHRLVCPGTVDERVEEVVAGKRHIANMVLPKSSSVGDLDAAELQAALGIDSDALLSTELGSEPVEQDETAPEPVGVA